jgi:hypothetical protein
MAKFKPARGKTPAKSNRGAIPCLILLVTVFLLLFLLFYAVLKSSG